MKTKFELVTEGPLPNRMDLWLEDEHYFHGLHEQMIGIIATSLRKPLFDLGYIIGRETSLQLARRLIPDAYIRNKDTLQTAAQFDYQTAAAELFAEPGIKLQDEPDLTAITIYQREPYQLVTLIEVVSPSNKANDDDITKYITRREELIFAQGVNIVEIDITRSYKRLTRQLTDHSPYHVAIYIPGHGLRVVPMALKDPFKRIAIPLTQTVLPLDLSTIYQQAYQEIGLADLMLNEGFYTLDHLPFASLLTQQERDEALAAVQAWQDAVKQA
jgi:hypothetical protein